MSGEIIVLVTAPPGESLQIAETLVDSGLAACVNILPKIKAVYVWQEKKCIDEEELLLIKSRRELFTQLCAKVKEIHSYQVPEIIQLPIENGEPAYLQWLNRQLKQVNSLEVGS